MKKNQFVKSQKNWWSLDNFQFVSLACSIKSIKVYAFGQIVDQCCKILIRFYTVIGPVFILMQYCNVKTNCSIFRMIGLVFPFSRNLTVFQGCGIPMPDSSDSGLFAGGQAGFPIALVCWQLKLGARKKKKKCGISLLYK